MDIQAMFPTVGGILIICYAIGEYVKLFPKIPNKIIPIIVAISGGILAIIGKYCGQKELMNLSLLDTIATGIVSGLSSSGFHAFIKTFTSTNSEESSSNSESYQQNI